MITAWNFSGVYLQCSGALVHSLNVGSISNGRATVRLRSFLFFSHILPLPLSSFDSPLPRGITHFPHPACCQIVLHGLNRRHTRTKAQFYQARCLESDFSSLEWCWDLLHSPNHSSLEQMPLAETNPNTYTIWIPLGECVCACVCEGDGEGVTMIL